MDVATERTRVLVVDDDPLVCEALRRLLAEDEYQVRTAGDGRSALAAFSDWPPTLVITDLRMTPLDGIELCRQIRSGSTVPIIVVSADADEQSKVAVLDAGADDYILKPFGSHELLGRIRAALRRPDLAAARKVLQVGDFRIDFDRRRIHIRGTEVRLTPREFELVAFLARYPNRVIPHARLLSTLWGAQWHNRREYLRVFVRQLRMKLEEDPAHPRYFMTEPWVGYQFNPRGTL